MNLQHVINLPSNWSQSKLFVINNDFWNSSSFINNTSNTSINTISQDGEASPLLPLKVLCVEGFHYYDYVGVSPLGTVSAKAMPILADQKYVARKLYPAHRMWVNLGTGKVCCPVPATTNANISAAILKLLLTNQYPLYTVGVHYGSKNWKITWNSYNLRGIYAHFGMY